MTQGIWRSKKIGVLMGGFSREREISLKSGHAMAEALRQRHYNVDEIDVDLQLIKRLLQQPIDVAVIALHGSYGEDGSMQGLLECLKIPYTGSGVLASAICLDKALTRVLVDLQGITIPEGIVLTRDDDLKSVENQIFRRLPVIVKPNREGSTIGIHVVLKREELKPAVEEALQMDSKVLIEDFIEGTEVTVALFEGRALTPLEVVPHSGFYDFKSKYTPGETEYILPARISTEMTERVQKQCELIFKNLGLKGIARADFIVRQNKKPYFLEINTIPGMMETSLVPKAAKYDGISFEDLVEGLLEGASLKVGS